MRDKTFNFKTTLLEAVVSETELMLSFSKLIYSCSYLLVTGRVTWERRRWMEEGLTIIDEGACMWATSCDALQPSKIYIRTWTELREYGFMMR